MNITGRERRATLVGID